MKVSKTFTTISMRILAAICLYFTVFIILSLLKFDNNIHYYIKVTLATSLVFIIYGLWTLKKWTLFLYIATSIVFQIFSLATHTWYIGLLIWPFINITTMIINYKNLK
jgi:hypothetical protein